MKPNWSISTVYKCLKRATFTSSELNHCRISKTPQSSACVTSHVVTLGQETTVCHQLQTSAETLKHCSNAKRLDTHWTRPQGKHTELPQGNSLKCAPLLQKTSKLEAAIGAGDRCQQERSQQLSTTLSTIYYTVYHQVSQAAAEIEAGQGNCVTQESES